MNPFLASFPIIALVAAMTIRAPKARLPLPAHIALPAAAVLALVLQTLAGADGTGATVLSARIIEGLLTSLTPLAIVFGAILLFKTLKSSGAMDAILARLEQSVPDQVMRVVLIAWSFSYLVEGLSGFGTPAALAAPLLVGLGFPPVRAAAACLVMNTVPVVFGAVGMPIWFGLGELELTAEQLQSIAISAAIVQCAAAPVVVALALRMLFPWKALRSRALQIATVVAATMGASTITALFSTEFPTIVGGVCSLAAAFAVGRWWMRRGKTARDTAEADAIAARAADSRPSNVTARGAASSTAIDKPTSAPTGSPAPARASATPTTSPDLPRWRAAFPLVATVALLALTRIEPLGLRDLLQADAPAATIPLGPVGDFSISPALVVGLADILRTDIAWSMDLLYVPFIIPFVIVVALSAPLLRLSARRTLGVAADAARSLTLPAIALAGALVFVKLMMHGEGEAAPVVAIGRGLAGAVAVVWAPLWLPAAPLVGALGSFFSGSATVSNLTFAPVQAEIAEQLHLDASRVLALQSVGAAMGNMVCIHNIVAVAAVLGLTGGGKTDRNGEAVNNRPDDGAGAPDSDTTTERGAASGWRYTRADASDASDARNASDATDAPESPRSAEAKPASFPTEPTDPVAAILRLTALPLTAFAAVAALVAAGMGMWG